MKIKKYTDSAMTTHWLFVILASVFGLVFVFMTPPFWGYDEHSHYSRAYEIADGVIKPNKQSVDNYGAVVPENVVSLGDYAIGDLVDNSNGAVFDRKDVRDRGDYGHYTNDAFSDARRNLTNSSSYSPAAYIGPVAGIALTRVFNLSVGSSIFLARFMSLIIYVGIVFFSLYLLKNKKIKWLFFAVALLPMALFQAATISADGTLIAVSLLLLASFIALMSQKDLKKRKKLYLLLACSAIVLPLIKPNYALLIFIILTIPSVIIPYKGWSGIVKSVAVSVSIIAAAIWSIYSKPGVNPPTSQRPDGLLTSANDQVAFILSSPLDFLSTLIRTLISFSDSYLTSMIGLIGWNYVALPSAFVFMSLLVIFVTGLYAREEIIRYPALSKYVLAFVGVIGILMIFGIMYIAFTPLAARYIEGVQGRYLIPYIIPIVIFLAAVIPVRLQASEKTVTVLTCGMVACTLSVSTILFLLATY